MSTSKKASGPAVNWPHGHGKVNVTMQPASNNATHLFADATGRKYLCGRDAQPWDRIDETQFRRYHKQFCKDCLDAAQRRKEQGGKVESGQPRSSSPTAEPRRSVSAMSLDELKAERIRIRAQGRLEVERAYDAALRDELMSRIATVSEKAPGPVDAVTPTPARRTFPELVNPFENQYEGQEAQAYRALMAAAKRLGQSEYRAQLAAHVKAGRSPNTFRHCPSEALMDLVNASGRIGKDLTAEDAMAMLHYGDTGHAIDQMRKAESDQQERNTASSKSEQPAKLRLSEKQIASLASQAVSNMGNVFYDADDFGDSETTNARIQEHAEQCVADAIRQAMDSISLTKQQAESLACQAVGNMGDVFYDADSYSDSVTSNERIQQRAEQCVTDAIRQAMALAGAGPLR